MKNIIFIVAFMLLMNELSYSQNYLNDGGFEQGNSTIDMDSTSPFHYTTVTRISRPSCVLLSSVEGYKYFSINTNSPGGFGGIHYKMQYWTDRGYYAVTGCPSSTINCFPHLAHWGYYNNSWPALFTVFDTFYLGYTGVE